MNEEIIKDLLKQSQEDIEIWKDLYNQEKEKNKKLVEEKATDMTNESLWKSYSNALSNKIEQLEKVIDMMVKDLSEFDIDELICKNSITGENDIGECDITCEECIKQYYFKKARGE